MKYSNNFFKVQIFEIILNTLINLVIYGCNISNVYTFLLIRINSELMIILILLKLSLLLFDLLLPTINPPLLLMELNITILLPFLLLLHFLLKEILHYAILAKEMSLLTGHWVLHLPQTQIALRKLNLTVHPQPLSDRTVLVLQHLLLHVRKSRCRSVVLTMS